MDHAVNAGVYAAGILVQKVLNQHGKQLVVDGGIGNNTINAINSMNPYVLHEAIKKARQDFYDNTGQLTFINGWTDRLEKFVYNKPAEAGFGALGILLLAGFAFWNIKMRKMKKEK